MIVQTIWLLGTMSGAPTPEISTPLTFDDALELATKASSDVIRAKEDLILVDADYKRALSAVLPRVDLSINAGGIFVATDVPQVGGGTVFSGRDSRSNYSMNLTANQLVYDGGRWWTQLAQVDDTEMARKSALSILTNDLRSSVAALYYGYAMQQVATRLIAGQVKVDEAQLERVQALMRVGRGTPADVAATLRNLAEDKSSLAQQQFSERAAARQLNVVIGREPDHPVNLVMFEAMTSTITPRWSLPKPADLVARADGTRPEIVALNAEIALAEKSVTIAQSGYYPSVFVGANYQRQNEDLDVVINDPTNNYFASVNVSVQWNLFEGRANQARVEEAAINLRKSQARQAELLRTIHSEVQDRLDNLRVQFELHQLALQTIDAAKEALRLARGLYEQGRGTLLEQRDAELRLANANINAQTLRLQIEIARQELHRAVGEDPFAPRRDT